MHILVTGCAGFIGSHLSKALLNEGHTVIGIDSLNDYYDVTLKRDRLARLVNQPNFTFHQLDICDRAALEKIFKEYNFTHVAHLAAQAGVRYSITNPESYINTNLVGFGHILELCKQKSVENLVYASSSSVYGANKTYPFSTGHSVDHPISLYAATKKSNELMAHCYSSLFNLPCTGLRFFTVYGPWGRPDMALFKFTKNILEGKAIDVYNHGKMARDFTYIDDIVNGVITTIKNPAVKNPAWNAENPDPSSSDAPYNVYNIGSNHPISLMEFIQTIEKKLNTKAKLNYLPMQPGDVEKTYADISPLKNNFGFEIKTDVETGVGKFVDWYISYYQTKDAALAL